jgi:hypothetical protein
MGGPPVLGLGVGLTLLTVKNKLVTKTFTKPRTWTDSLEKRPKRKKMDMRFGTWNVRRLYRAGSLRTVAEEVSKYQLNLPGHLLMGRYTIKSTIF